MISEKDRQIMIDEIGESRLKYIFALSPQIGFTPDSDEVIFIESRPNRELEAWLERHSDEVNEMMKKRGYKFTYVPNRVLQMGKEGVLYNRPGYNVAGELECDVAKVIDKVYKPFYENAVTPIPDEPMLIRYKIVLSDTERYNARSGNRQANHIFSYASLPTEASDEEWMQIFTTYTNHIGEEPVYYSLAKAEHPKDIADYKFFDEVQKLSEEIKERVERLRQLGVSELIINSLLDIKPVAPSRLVITRDYKLMLPDYDNKEIKMSVLAKVLYMFYLNHPEGVAFKRLSDYKIELMQYYKDLSNRVDLVKMWVSINDLVDSTKNSVNEKCSMIRAAFLKEFDENVAEQYVITADSFYLKKIKLDRNLVIDESGIFNSEESKYYRQFGSTENA